MNVQKHLDSLRLYSRQFNAELSELKKYDSDGKFEYLSTKCVESAHKFLDLVEENKELEQHEIDRARHCRTILEIISETSQDVFNNLSMMAMLISEHIGRLQNIEGPAYRKAVAYVRMIHRINAKLMRFRFDFEDADIDLCQEYYIEILNDTRGYSYGSTNQIRVE